jgi:transposase
VKALSLSEKELDEIWRASKRHAKPYVRTRALGIILVAKGYPYRKIARFLQICPNTVCNWVKRVQEGKIQDLIDKPGRGRKSRADPQKVLDIVRRSPSQFGFKESRWTLSLLKSACPELSDMTVSGVWRLLKNIGISWKRGQHKLTSPDPDYLEKKTL